MTKQELISSIRSRNPQYNQLPDDVLFNFAIKQKPELTSQLTQTSKDKRTEEAKGLINDLKSQQVVPQMTDDQHPLRDFGIGFLKGVGRSLADTAKLAPLAQGFTNPINAAINAATGKQALYGKATDKILNSTPVKETEEMLKSKNKMEKYGGYAEVGAELATGGEILRGATKGVRSLSKAKKSLTLATDELRNLNNSVFKRIFNMDKGELEKTGGFIKQQTQKMPTKITEYAGEFKEVLQSKDPLKNLNNVKKLGKNYRVKVLDLFDGNNPAINAMQLEKQLVSHIKRKVPFSGNSEAVSFSKKATEDFLSEVKTGTLKGMEEALAKFRYKGGDASGKMKTSYKVIQDSVKQIIKEGLPDGKQKTYDALKRKQAQLFDIQDILKAKNKVVKKGSSVGNAIKKTAVGAAIVGGVTAGVAGVKNLFK